MSHNQKSSKYFSLKNLQARKWRAILITDLIAWLFTVIGIYWFKEYGIGIFILTPLFIGVSSVIIYGSGQETKVKEAFAISTFTLIFYTLGLLIFAIEGIICLLMAAPIGLLICWTGAVIGHVIISKIPDRTRTFFILFGVLIPLSAFVDKNISPELTAVTTSVEIEANPEIVWKQLIAFPPLKQPQEWLFRAGIAYPTDATIQGSGVGAIRHCNFTTGSFVEPVTVWDEPVCLNSMCWSNLLL